MRRRSAPLAAAFERRAVLVLPGLAVAVVAITVLFLGRPRPTLGARMRGGPTEGAALLALRLEIVLVTVEGERPFRGDAAVDAELEDGERLSWAGATDDEGAAEVRLVPRGGVAGPVCVRVHAGRGSEPVLDACFRRTVPEWSGDVRRGRLWVESGAGPLVLRAAAERGTFAVPFEDGLVVEARAHGQPLPAAKVVARAEGAECSPAEAQTDARGRARFSVRPIEHQASVTLHAETSSAAFADLVVSLPVMPGAMHLVSPGADCERGCALFVESPILRDRAYVALVSETTRLAGGRVALSPDPKGGARGVFTVDSLPPHGPLWAVASSEPDLRSPARVGWPVFGPRLEPRATFDVSESLLVDGVGDALSREARRVRRIRLFAALWAAAALGSSALLVVLRARAAKSNLERHLAESGADAEETTRMAGGGLGSVGPVAAAALMLLLAAGLAYVFTTWR